MVVGFVGGVAFHRKAPALVRSSKGVITRRAGRVVRCLGEGSSGAGLGPFGDSKGDDVSTTISKVIDGSFRKVWFVLLTKGLGEPYNLALQSFILGVMAAYKKGFSIPALQMEISMAKDIYEGPNAEEINKFIQLNENEKKTRYVWIILVYLALQKLRFPSENKNMTVPKDELVPSLQGLVDDVSEAYKKGFSFDGLKMEITLKKQPGQPEISADAASIRSQWMRIVYITNQLVASNQADRTDGKGGTGPASGSG
ncbi:hypothetical protein NDN08_001144 [Rhodosorus marinus]|uniref:Uncharacterized protein n=1 Tax=Rhodosorus marinus TaxID=101924 RepID=A0AAV8UQ33_9RHOD|nr:hypothetical protein NDN08_001144 [Rhodosorus marinus]